MRSMERRAFAALVRELDNDLDRILSAANAVLSDQPIDARVDPESTVKVRVGAMQRLEEFRNRMIQHRGARVK